MHKRDTWTGKPVDFVPDVSTAIRELASALALDYLPDFRNAMWDALRSLTGEEFPDGADDDKLRELAGLGEEKS